MATKVGKTNGREYNALDIMKFILAIFVMIIHSGMDKTILSPLLRLAVPLFFLVSSFFFFARKEKQGSLLRFLKRNLYLYLIWSIVQLPITLISRDYLQGGMGNTLRSILLDLVLGNGFTGSWYIMAMIIAVPVVVLVSKKIPSGWLVLLTFPIYLVCCFSTNYWNLLDPSSWLVSLVNGYQNLSGLYFHTSFPIALFWVSVGKWIAENAYIIKTKLLWFLLAGGSILLLVERYLVVRYQWENADDCYFMLAIVCPAIFLLLKRCPLVFRSSLRFREYSTLIYVTHGSCERLVGYGLKVLPLVMLQSNIFKVVISLVIILACGILLFRLKDKGKIKLLGYVC